MAFSLLFIFGEPANPTAKIFSRNGQNLLFILHLVSLTKRVFYTNLV